MKASGKPIDKYLATVPPSHRAALRRVRAIVRKAYPAAEEGLYYQLPAFRLNGKAFVAFRSSKAHCSLLPLSGTVLPSLKAKLAAFECSRGTIRFTPEHPIPESLIKEILRVRTQELHGR
ncbi:MAG TPA: DUF1801 domain-containing protein [Gemmatimonadales bacterium]|nr:DUF1801 domain-containing protein [Gemmatimonadales bacterium]